MMGASDLGNLPNADFVAGQRCAGPVIRALRTAGHDEIALAASFQRALRQAQSL